MPYSLRSNKVRTVPIIIRCDPTRTILLGPRRKTTPTGASHASNTLSRARDCVTISFSPVTKEKPTFIRHTDSGPLPQFCWGFGQSLVHPALGGTRSYFTAAFGPHPFLRHARNKLVKPPQGGPSCLRSINRRCPRRIPPSAHASASAGIAFAIGGAKPGATSGRAPKPPRALCGPSSQPLYGQPSSEASRSSPASAAGSTFRSRLPSLLSAFFWSPFWWRFSSPCFASFHGSFRVSSSELACSSR